MSLNPGQLRSLWSSLPTLFTVVYMQVLTGALQSEGSVEMALCKQPQLLTQPQALPSVPGWQGDARHSTGGVSHLLKKVTNGL